MSLDSFYSDNNIENWLKVLGPKLHYHYGKVNPNDPYEDIMDFRIRQLYQWIPDGGTILDCGCGWGGPAKMIAREKKCQVTGVTISKEQYKYLCEYATEIKPVLADLHDYSPSMQYDLAVFIESFSHLHNPSKVLSNLSLSVDRLLLVDYDCIHTDPINHAWHMKVHRKEETIEILQGAGYELKFFDHDLTLEDVRKTGTFWLSGLRKLNPTEEIGHLKLLKSIANIASNMYEFHLWKPCIFYAEKEQKGNK